jgi:ABC-type protease/lipase transport system fused ATPase/permease subunit
VVYHPSNASRAILNRINFTLQPGESLAIVGPTASGKSSLARLVTGIEAPSAGDVRLDGTMLHAWPSADRGRHIGYLPQQVELMTGTVFENVSRFEENATEENVWKAIDISGARAVIEALAHGLSTEVGENGGFLSGGQRQRIGLARAVYGDIKLVVLDEPNANLDAAGEKALGEALQTMKAQGTTVIVILHRPNVLSVVDYIMVMRDGGIQKFAPRDEMLPLIGSISKQVAEAPMPIAKDQDIEEPKRIDAGP